MADDKNIRGQGDRSRINTTEAYELTFIEQKLNVSREEVLQAIQEVGNEREKVEEYLKGKPNR